MFIFSRKKNGENQHKITPVTGNERGDLEVKDYIVLQKPQAQDNRRPSPHTLISNFTMTHVRFGRSLLLSMGQLTNIRNSDRVPDPDGTIKAEVRIKIRITTTFT